MWVFGVVTANMFLLVKQVMIIIGQKYFSNCVLTD